MKNFESLHSPRLTSPNNLESFKIPEYDLEKGIERVLEIIQEKLLTQEKPIIIEIAGGSASGKTSAVSFKIKEILGDKALILSMDDYCYERTFIDNRAKKGEIFNDDQPEALDLELLKSHLIKLKDDKTIEKPVFDLKESKRVGFVTIQPHKVIIVEGLFALNDLLINEGDIKIFVDTSTHGRLLRRLFRDTERTGKEPINTLRYFLDVIVQMHEKYVQSTKKNADILIRNEYNPEIEAQKTNLYEIQKKFKGELDLEYLQNIGAKSLGSIDQEDQYYNINESKLNETGEILRIRNENGHKILTYKGPRITSDFQVRSKFEFEIDNEIETKFLSIYGDPIKIIKKKCLLYQLNNITFSIENVSNIENKKETEVGKFIEIKSTNKDTDTKEIENLISKLGSSIKDDIKKSYFEM